MVDDDPGFSMTQSARKDRAHKHMRLALHSVQRPFWLPECFFRQTVRPRLISDRSSCCLSKCLYATCPAGRACSGDTESASLRVVSDSLVDFHGVRSRRFQLGRVWGPQIHTGGPGLITYISALRLCTFRTTLLILGMFWTSPSEPSSCPVGARPSCLFGKADCFSTPYNGRVGGTPLLQGLRTPSI